MSTDVRRRAGCVVALLLLAVCLRSSVALTQSVTAKPDQTPVFTCGTDQVISQAIPVNAENVVLAGDGRLYIACPDFVHSPDHRENRERAVLNEALRSSDAETRWRAVQATIRLTAALRRDITAQDLNGPDSSGQNVPIVQIRANPIVVDFDVIGVLTHEMVIKGACRTEAQVFDGATDPKRWQPGKLFVYLLDLPPQTTVRGVTEKPNSNNPLVKLEAAYALGTRLSHPGIHPDIVTAATREIQACFRTFVEKDWALAGWLLEDIGETRYERDDQIAEAESFLVAQDHGPHVEIVMGATKGLEALYRQHGQYPISQGALLLLRQLARYGSQVGTSDAVTTVYTDARVRRLALMGLQAARDHDTATLRAAALDGDWQVRRLVAGSLNLADPEQRRLGEILAQDSTFQVRYDLLASVSRLARQTQQCAPLVKYFKDPSLTVVMRAMDLLFASCTDLDEPIATLIDLTDVLVKPDAVYDWHVVARAMAALARVKPEAAEKAMTAAAKHTVWQVRATAAAASVDAKNEAIAVKLAADKEPNVQTAALDALFRMRSTEVVPAAIAVLSNAGDYQAARMAAMVLKGLPAESKEDASDALLGALRKLTAHESDTSREARLAIIERLAETLDPGRSYQLLPYATDFDDEVNRAVVKSLTALGSFLPGRPSVKRRYPYQPYAYQNSPGLLKALPQSAQIDLDDGVVQLKLLTDVAPVTVARFVELADRGYYNSLTFHRVVPNFFVQGGSPGANDYAGTSRFMRDEVGPQAVHVRGAVGMMTRGSDTGNGQIFIDLVDAPSLDRDYTVFAYVTQGMERVDKLLEGAIIRSVSVR